MIIIDNEFVDLATPSGDMRTHIFRPADQGKYPGIILFSEIYQVTGPIRRTAAILAGFGYVVVVPEVYHEFEPLGKVLCYNPNDTAIGNAHKIAKPVQAYDDDAQVCVNYLDDIKPGFNPY